MRETKTIRIKRSFSLISRFGGGILRQIKCRNCGTIFLTDKQESSLCPECVKEIRKKAVYREHNCIDCGRQFMGYPKSKRCPECQAKINRERNKKYKKNGPERKLGGEDFCQNCGKPYIVNSGRQKYCPECAEIVVRETLNKGKREWIKEHRDPEKRRENQKERRVCVVCGKNFSSPLPTITCSPECAKEQKRRKQAIADVKRGRLNPARILSKMPHPNPQSGIRGITWHQGKWQLQIKGKYIGIYNTIDEATAVKKSMEEKQHED